MSNVTHTPKPQKPVGFSKPYNVRLNHTLVADALDKAQTVEPDISLAKLIERLMALYVEKP